MSLTPVTPPQRTHELVNPREGHIGPQVSSSAARMQSGVNEKGQKRPFAWAVVHPLLEGSIPGATSLPVRDTASLAGRGAIPVPGNHYGPCPCFSWRQESVEQPQKHHGPPAKHTHKARESRKKIQLNSVPDCCQSRWVLLTKFGGDVGTVLIVDSLQFLGRWVCIMPERYQSSETTPSPDTPISPCTAQDAPPSGRHTRP